VRGFLFLAATVLILLAPTAASLEASPAAPRVGDLVTLRVEAPAAAALELLAGANVTAADGPFHVHAPRVGWNMLHAALVDADGKPIRGATLRVNGSGLLLEDSAEVAPGDYRLGFAMTGSGRQVLRASAVDAAGETLAEGELDVTPASGALRTVQPMPLGGGQIGYVILVTPDALLTEGGNLTVAVFGASGRPLTEAAVTAWAEFSASPGGAGGALPALDGARYGAPFAFPRPGLWDLQVNVTLPGTPTRSVTFTVPVFSGAPYRWAEALTFREGAWSGVVAPNREGDLLLLVHGGGRHEALGIPVRGERAEVLLVSPEHDVGAGTTVRLSYRVSGPVLEEPDAEGAAATIRLTDPEGGTLGLPARLEGGYVNATHVPALLGEWRVTLEVPSLRITGAGATLLQVVDPATLPGDKGHIIGDPGVPVEVKAWWSIPGPTAGLAALALVGSAFLLSRVRNR